MVRGHVPAAGHRVGGDAGLRPEEDVSATMHARGRSAPVGARRRRRSAHRLSPGTGRQAVRAHSGGGRARGSGVGRLGPRLHIRPQSAPTHATRSSSAAGPGPEGDRRRPRGSGRGHAGPDRASAGGGRTRSPHGGRLRRCRPRGDRSSDPLRGSRRRAVARADGSLARRRQGGSGPVGASATVGDARRKRVPKAPRARSHRSGP